MYILSVVLYIISFIFSFMTSVALLVKPKVFPYLNHNLKDKNDKIQKRYRVANLTAGIISLVLSVTLFLGGVLFFHFIKTKSFIPLLCVLISIIIYVFLIVFVPYLILKGTLKYTDNKENKL